jgi:hypothetical protein
MRSLLTTTPKAHQDTFLFWIFQLAGILSETLGDKT